jgi:F-type H+-transporting ATPase subunit a
MQAPVEHAAEQATTGAASAADQVTAAAGQVVGGAEAAGHAAAEAGFDAGELIMGHVANSSLEHPLLHLPPVFGIDIAVTKHVLMLWLVAGALFVFAALTVRRYLASGAKSPSKVMTALEFIVEFIRDNVVEPNVGRKWVMAYTPLFLTFFLFIFAANIIGLIPIFDLLALVNHTVLHLPPDSFLSQVTHGSVTATGNFNVTAGLATISFLLIIVAGVRAHGFFQHFKNMVPHGLPLPVTLFLIPIEIMGMFVRPFALTMRLAANMSGGHIAILAILSFVFIFDSRLGSVAAIGIGALSTVLLAVPISGLEIIVVVVQAYVFTLLTAVFVGMAIHAHH